MRSPSRNASTTVNAGAASLIQATSKEPSEVIRISRKTQTDTAEVEPEALDGIDYLETLAQEIYQRLRQRMRVEQERQGGDYAGRLPW